MIKMSVITLDDNKHYMINFDRVKNLFELDSEQEWEKSDYLIEVSDANIKKRSYNYELNFSGELFKDSVKIIDRIYNITDVYKDSIICDSYDGKLMAYQDSVFYDLVNSNEYIYKIYESRIAILHNNKFYQIDSKDWLDNINTKDMLNFHKICASFYEMDYSNKNNLEMISTTIEEEDAPYLYFSDNTMRICFGEWMPVKTPYNDNDVIDIFSWHHPYNGTSDIIFINKNSFVDFSVMKPEPKKQQDKNMTENLNLIKRIHFNGQIIKYNRKNIFNNKNIYDMLDKIEHFTNSTKNQILTLLCVLKRHIVMPKPLKLMIIEQALKF